MSLLQLRLPSGRFAEQARGVLNPWLIRATRSTDYDVSRTLVISGFPRSGTTWLAELVANVPRTAVLFEPLDFRAIPAARKAGSSWDNFRAPDEVWPEGMKYLDRVLKGRVLTSWTTSHIPLKRAVRISRWIVKFVRANQMLGWLLANFDVPPPVLLIRHPCAVYSSWVSRGWPLVTYPLPAGLRFFSHYPEFRDWVRSLRTPEEIFAAQWSIQHFTALTQLRSHPYFLCPYERLVLEGLHEVKRVLAHWDLPVPSNIEEALLQPSAKASTSLAASSKSQIDSWKRHMDTATIDRIIQVLDRFGLDFYTSQPEPDYGRLAEFAGRGLGGRSFSAV